MAPDKVKSVQFTIFYQNINIDLADIRIFYNDVYWRQGRQNVHSQANFKEVRDNLKLKVTVSKENLTVFDTKTQFYYLRYN